MKRILAVIDRCSGCRLCEMICSFVHEKAFSSSASRITVIKEDAFGLDLPVLCCHCDPCSAAANCPTTALVKNDEGFIVVKEEECIGCGKCSETCLVGGIKLHPETNIPLICDQCGGKPRCVEECPTKALIYVDLEGWRPKPPSEIINETLRRWGVTA